MIMYQFKGKDSEIKAYPLSLRNISNNSTTINMKKTELKGSVHVNSVNSKTMGTSNFLDICKYLMKKSWYKVIFRYIKKIFIELLSVCAVGSFGESLAPNSKGPVKCVSI